jgi:hypothetical protein
MEKAHQAQRVLQRFFFKVVRPTGLRSSARQFCGICTGMVEEAKAITFEELSEKLRRDDVLDVSGSLLLRFIQLINWNGKRRPNHHVCLTGVINVKIFLAAYMIAARPDRVFESQDEKLEKEVFEASEPLLVCFHQLARNLCERSWAELAGDTDRKQLRTLLCTYLRTFKAWKIEDEAKLAGRIRHAIRGLESAMETEDANENEPIREEILKQHKRLREKLVQIEGVTSEDGEEQQQPSSSSSSSKRHKNASGTASAATSASVAKKTSSVGGGAANNKGGIYDSSNSSGNENNGMTNEQLAHELLLDPLFELRSMYDDDDATRKKDPFADERLVKTTLRKVFERAFWDSLLDDLCLQPCPLYSRVMSVLEEIRNGVCSLSKIRGEQPSGIAQRIMDVIDTELITQRIGAGALDYHDCIGLVDCIIDVRLFVFDDVGGENCFSIIFLTMSPQVIVSLHESMKEYKRKEQTTRMWQELKAKMTQALLSIITTSSSELGNKDSSSSISSTQCQKFFCEALELCLDRVYAARVDSANIKLRLIAPVIHSHGIEYLRGQFEKKLEKGSITLDNTKRWMGRVVKGLEDSKDQRVCLATAKASPSLACKEFEKILWIAAVDLVAHEGFKEQERGKFPEVFGTDFLRIKDLHAQFHGQVSAATILITLDQEIRRQVRDGIARSQLLRSISNAVLLHHHNHHHQTAAAATAAGGVKKVFLPGVNGISASGVVQQALDVLRKFQGIPEDSVKVIGALIEKHLQRNHPVYLHLVILFDFLFHLFCKGCSNNNKLTVLIFILQVKRFKNFWFVALRQLEHNHRQHQQEEEEEAQQEQQQQACTAAVADVSSSSMGLLSVYDSSNLLKLPDIAKPLIAEAEAQARKFACIAAINKRVHITRYNEIITECCSKL